MKKTILSLAISSLFLTACDDATNIEKKAEPVSQAVEQKAIDTNKAVEKDVKKVVSPSASPAERSETVFKTLTEGTGAYYNKILSVQPVIKSFRYEMVSFEKGDVESKAVTKAILDLRSEVDGKSKMEINLNHVITHDNGTVKITSLLEAPSDASNQIKPIIDSFMFVTEVKADDSLVQTASLKPVTLEEKGVKVDIKGINVVTTSSLEKIKGGFGAFKGKVDGLDVTEDTENKFALSPFDFSGFYNENFEYSFDTTPVKFTSEELSGSTEKISSNGTYELKSEYAMALGKQITEIQNLEFSGEKLPQPIKLKSVNYSLENSLNGDKLFNSVVDMNIVPEAESLKPLTQGKLNIQSLNVNFTFQNIAADVVKKANELNKVLVSQNAEDGVLSEEKEKVLKEEGQAIFDSLKTTGANLGMNYSLKADEGDITLNSTFNAIKDSTVNFEELLKLEDPKLILQVVNINADISAPAKLLEDLAGPNIMMLGMFMKKEGEFYKSKVTTEEGKLLINGTPAPF